MKKIVTKIKENKLLTLIIVLGVILRFYNLDFQSVWLDEIHTLNEANPSLSFSEVYNSLLNSEQMPPLYFYSLYYIFKVFGYTTFVARFFSAIIGVFSVYGMYLFGKELINKKIGLISALLLVINPFHLYYSQEARPYILLFLFSIFSFYYFVKFLKQTNYKYSIYYGVFTGLMLLSHFFGMFVLFSQLFIFMFFLIINEKQKRNKFLILSLISGLIISILFLPAIKVLIKISEIKEFWIPAPTLDAYTLIFKEFFGNSEMVLCLLGIFIFFYFVKLANEKQILVNTYTIVNNKIVLSFVILLPWISIVLLVPLIRSYLTVPMIISRYFIVVLPAILIIVSIGISHFKNKIIQFSLLGLFIVFSITDIFIIKKYHFVTTKSQFREGSQFINDNNKSNNEVVSSLAWYFPFFIKNKIVEHSLETHIDEMIKDTTKIKPFWYIDSHGRKYEPQQKTLDFIEKHFYIQNNFNGHDVWVKEFNLIGNKPMIDLSKLKIIPANKPSRIESNIEVSLKKDNIFTVSGWALVKNIDSRKNKIELFLIDKNSKINITPEQVIRKDITSFFSKDNVNYDFAGFTTKIDLNKITDANYKLAIYISNKENNFEEIKLTNLEIKK